MRRLRMPAVGALMCLLFLLPAAVAASPTMPLSTLLLEESTGQVLEAQEPHRRFPPASLSKLMTLYLTFQAIQAGRFSLDTPVTVSARAWRIGRSPRSSRMFLDVGDIVTVAQLLEGLLVASGNDAAEALAEAVAGSPDQFVTEMNAAAARLGMRDTHFVTPHGLPAPDESTSAWDMALLARRILLENPDVIHYSSPRYATYAGITQANWNNLVFRDPRVDGLKTGHTAEAGFSIVATAHQGPMRLIAVVLGAPTLRQRTAVAERLLDTGFTRYGLVAIPWQTVVPAALSVYGGTTTQLPLDTAGPVRVLLPRDARPALVVSEQITVSPFAPFSRGQRVGLLTVSREESVVLTMPLFAAATVEPGGVPTRMWGALQYALSALTHQYRTTWTGAYTPHE